MPVVPTSTGPRVEETANPNIRRGITSTPQVSQPLDLSGVASVAHNIYQEETQRADQIALVRASAELATTANHLQVITAQKKGEQAFDTPDEVQASWEKSVSAIAGTMRTQRQKDAFQARVANEWVGLDSFVQRHVAQERTTYDTQQTKALLDSKHDQAILNYGDPRAVDLAVNEQLATVKDFGARNGLPPEAIAQQVADTRSQTYTQVIARMLDDGNDLGAQRYYTDKKDQLTGEDQGRLAKALEQGSILGESQRQADAILAKNPTKTDAYEASKQIQNPKVRQETEQRLDVEFRRRKQAEEDQYDGVLNNALSYAEKGGKPPASVWAQISSKDKLVIDNILRERATGQEIKTDNATYYKLSQMALSPDPAQQQAFTNAQLLSYGDRLSRSDFQHFADLQAHLKQGKQSQMKPAVATQSLINATIRSFTKTGDQLDTEKAGAFTLEANTAILNAREANGGKPLDPRDEQKIIDEVGMRNYSVYKDGWFSDTQTPLEQIAPEDRTKAYVPYDRIPKEDQAAFEQYAKRQGFTLNRKNAEKAYVAWLDGDQQGALAILRGK